jgi:hypothetical protein
MVGSDGIPWETRIVQRDGLLEVSRDTQESGRFVIPWRSQNGRCVTLSTATLISSDEPYHLSLELCRGTLNQLQHQVALWESRGWPVPEQLRQQLAVSLRHFVQASLSRADVERCAMKAGASLQVALGLLDQVGQEVVAFSAANGSVRDSPGVLGFTLGEPSQVSSLKSVAGPPFNFCFVRTVWRDSEPNPSEWSWQSIEQMMHAGRRARLRVGCGPLLHLSRDDLPDWLYLWGDDFEAIQSYVVNYIREAVRQFSGRVSLWNCAAATNTQDALELTEEQRLRLTVSVLETLRQTDPRTPAIVSIRQPWGEYLGRTAMDLSPWQFADILVRGDLGLSGIGLELSVACCPGKTLTRSLLDFNRLIDRWAIFGLPLVLFLSLPTPSLEQEEPRPEMSFVEDLLRLLASRNSVHGIVWNVLYDSTEWAGGLFDSKGKAKPILGSLQRFAS